MEPRNRFLCSLKGFQINTDSVRPLRLWAWVYLVSCLLTTAVSIRIGTNRIYNSIAVFKYLVKSDLVTMSLEANSIKCTICSMNRVAISREMKNTCIRRGPTLGDFVTYPHRGVDVGRHSCKAVYTEYMSTDATFPPLF
jgi:hypothetical protein